MLSETRGVQAGAETVHAARTLEEVLLPPSVAHTPETAHLLEPLELPAEPSGLESFPLGSVAVTCGLVRAPGTLETVVLLLTTDTGLLLTATAVGVAVVTLTAAVDVNAPLGRLTMSSFCVTSILVVDVL